MRATTKFFTAAGVFLGLAAGCAPDTKPTNAKLETALNAYFEDRNECLFPTALKFPYEVSPGSEAKEAKKRMGALTSAGLLREEDAPALHVERYTLTPLGERVAGRFCYGHRRVKSIDSFTPAAKQPNGIFTTNVTYHYTMMDVPVWARTDEMEAAFPKMAVAVSDNASDQITLATVGAGWQVPQ